VTTRGARGAPCPILRRAPPAPAAGDTSDQKGALMARQLGSSGFAGISTGGILVIIGIVVALLWSLILGIIIAVVGLVAFGGFVRGKWY
jgi:hypothetical protein